MGYNCITIYGDGGKARATRESILANVCHAITDSDGGKAGATRESITSNTRHTVRDGDGGKARATRVFATYCVPIRFV